jgi:hypothetical protein
MCLCAVDVESKEADGISCDWFELNENVIRFLKCLLSLPRLDALMS